MNRSLWTATAVYVTDAEDKTAFDKFHVIKLFITTVEQVRRDENRALLARAAEHSSAASTFGCQRQADMKPTSKPRFKDVQKLGLKVGRTCAVEESAQELWRYPTRVEAAKA